MTISGKMIVVEKGVRCIYTIIRLLFGIALFLFGMNLMSDHLKKIAGSKAEILLSKLTQNPLRAATVGAGVTSLIQSSGAAGAMTLSLVENDILEMRSAIAIIIGSIFGTSATGWIVAYSTLGASVSVSRYFSPYMFGAVFAIVGIIFKVFIKKKQIKRTGEIFLGFSILMLGIDTISQSLVPFKDSQSLKSFISSADNAVLLFFFGIILSLILQSASASVGILQSISVIGIIHLQMVIPMILGIGIGASFPVLLAAAGKSNNAKRCAFSYLFVDTGGAAMIGAVYYLFKNISGFNDTNIICNSFTIAAINTVYRFLIFIIFLPFTKQIEAVSKKVVKRKRRTTRIVSAQE